MSRDTSRKQPNELQERGAWAAARAIKRELVRLPRRRSFNIMLSFVFWTRIPGGLVRERLPRIRHIRLGHDSERVSDHGGDLYLLFLLALESPWSGV